MTDKERMEERIYIFADADKRKSLTAKELAEHTAQDSRIEQASVEKVMDAIFKQIKEQLLNGHFIKLPGLGTLKIGVHPATDKDGKSVGGAKTEKEYSCQKHLGGAHLLFQPSQDIKSELHAVKFDASSDEQHLAELAALNADDGE